MHNVSVYQTSYLKNYVRLSYSNLKQSPSGTLGITVVKLLEAQRPCCHPTTIVTEERLLQKKIITKMTLQNAA